MKKGRRSALQLAPTAELSGGAYRPTSMARRRIAVVVTLLLVAACGEDDDPAGAPASSPVELARPPATSIAPIVVARDRRFGRPGDDVPPVDGAEAGVVPRRARLRRQRAAGRDGEGVGPRAGRATRRSGSTGTTSAGSRWRSPATPTARQAELQAEFPDVGVGRGRGADDVAAAQRPAGSGARVAGRRRDRVRRLGRLRRPLGRRAHRQRSRRARRHRPRPGGR